MPAAQCYAMTSITIPTTTAITSATTATIITTTTARAWLSWKMQAVHEAVRELHLESRDRVHAAYTCLMHTADSAYREFIAEHNAWLTGDRVRSRLPVQYILTKYLENALWPDLYPFRLNRLSASSTDVPTQKRIGSENCYLETRLQQPFETTSVLGSWCDSHWAGKDEKYRSPKASYLATQQHILQQQELSNSH